MRRSRISRRRRGRRSTRRRFSRRPRRTRRFGRRVGTRGRSSNDFTLNAGRERTVVLKRSVVKGLNFNGGGIDVSQYVYGPVTFDPSGTQGNTGTVTQWANYLALYEYVRTPFVRLRFYVQYSTDTGGDAIAQNPYAGVPIMMYYKPWEDPGVSTGSFTWVELTSMNGVKGHVFSPEHPVWNVTLPLKQRGYVWNKTNVLPSDAESVFMRPQWVSTGQPMPSLYGFMFGASLIPANVSIFCDVDYVMHFKGTF